MIMPSFTTLPESMLGGQAVAQKFQSPALAGLRGLGMRGIYQGEGLSGLGCGCSDNTCDDGQGDFNSCCDPDPCPVTVSDCAYGGDYPNCNPAPTSSTSTFNASDCAYGGTYPNCNPAPATTSPTSTVPAFCASVGETYNPSTDLCNVAASGSSSGLTASQIAAITTGATKVGLVAAAGATGATVLANGTVIGSPSAAGSVALSSALSSMLPILLIGLVAFVAVKGMSK